MGLAHSPRITTKNLLLNLDFANIKNYSSGENLLRQSGDISVSPWTVFGANVSRTANSIIAPDGNLTADTLATSSWVSGDSVYQDISIANGTIPYTLSIFVKAGTATSITLSAFYLNTVESFSVNFNPVTGVVTGGTGFVVAYPDGWYRLYIVANGTIAGNTALRLQVYLGNTGSVYLWGAQIEKGIYLNSYTPTTSTAVSRSNNVTSTVSSYTLTKTTPSSNYAQYNNGVMNFTRLAGAANATVKQTAGDAFWTTITQTNLKPSTFLYNDFTWEVWFKINDINGSGYDATENDNALCVYRGWHQGFLYNSSVLTFWILNNTGPAYDNFTTPISNFPAGAWTQAVVTRSGNNYSMYKNGSLLTTATKTVVAIADGVYTSNDLHIGGAKSISGNVDFIAWTKMDFACTNMYNRALTTAEISQNFNALRGRFGI